MNKVYITQEPVYWDPEQKCLVPKLDLSTAAEYGEPVVLTNRLTSRDVGMSSQPVVREMLHKLRDFKDGDYLLLAGDPTIIMIAGIIASQMNRGRVKFLKWDKYLNQRRGGYVSGSIDASGKTL